MKNTYTFYSFVFLLAVFVRQLASAQGNDVAKGPITAVFIQMRAEQSKINAFKLQHKNTLLREVLYDRERVQAATIADFKDHFHYCPVFYFSDSNYEQVKQKQFSGILFNLDGTPVTPIPANLENSHYLIVSVGKPYYQSRSEKEVTDSSNNQGMSNMPYENALIICNENMKQAGYLYKLTIGAAKKKNLGKYYYHSKDFNIEYYPAATKLNKVLQIDPYHIPIQRI